MAEEGKRTDLAFRLAILGVSLLALGLALPTVGGDFLNWDDEWLVVTNPFLDEVGDLAWIVDPTAYRQALGAEYLPVRDISYWIDGQIWGVDPFGYRLGNVLLYGVLAGLVALFLRRLTGSRTAAIVGGVLFAAHPVHVECFAWISERKGLLAACFLLGSLLLHPGRRSPTRAWIAFGLFVLAALSKSTVHFAAPLILALGWLRSRRSGEPFVLRTEVFRVAPYVATSLVLIALNAHHQANAGASYGWDGASTVDAISVVGTTALRSIGNLALPIGLSADYRVTPSAAGLLAAAALAALLLGSALVVIRGGRFAPAIAFTALAWLPVSNLVPLPNRMADRYLLFVSIGAAGLAGLAVEPWLRAARRRVAILSGLLVVVVSFSALSLGRGAVWTDPLALWEDTAARSPRSGRAFQNLGETRLRRGDVHGALEAFDRMVELDPDQGDWWDYAAVQYREAGHPDRAEELFREGLRRAPLCASLHISLALLLAQSGRGLTADEEAHRLLRTVAHSSSFRRDHRAVAHDNLAVFHFMRGQFEVGIGHSKEALALEPLLPDERNILENLVQACRSSGREAEAVRYAERLQKIVERLGPPPLTRRE